MHENHAPLSQDIIQTSVKSFLDGEPVREHRTEILGLQGSSGAYLLAKLIPETAETFVILAPDHKTAERFFQDLTFYYPAEKNILFFPHWGVNPYEPLNPHLEIEATRIVSLAALQSGKARAIILPARALMQQIIPRQTLAELQISLETEEEYNRDNLLKTLVKLGYNAMSLVEERGTFSVRGDILDVFPPTTSLPVRVEFFGDFVEKIRSFDPVSQRTAKEEMEKLTILPVREMILTDQNLEFFSKRLKKRCDELGLPRPLRESILSDIREGLLFPGCSSLLPLSFEKLDTFFDYVPQSRWVIIDPPAVRQELERFSVVIQEGAAKVAEKNEPYVSPKEFYLSADFVEEQLLRKNRLDLSLFNVSTFKKDFPVFHFNTLSNSDLRHEANKPGGNITALAEQLKKWLRNDWSIVLVCHQQGQAQRLLDILESHELAPEFIPEWPVPDNAGKLTLVLGGLSAGFRLPEGKLAIITEEEIFGARTKRRTSRKSQTKDFLSSFSELKEKDYVVHTDHGIARYHGLLHLQTNQVEGDYLNLEYAGGDKLYLPIDRIEKIQKYIGSEGHAPRLDRMGGNAWDKAVLKARAAVEELAGELLKIYARREIDQGFQYSPPDSLFREFEASFPYEETEDQFTAIQNVLEDMQSPKSMDRLICGDVGYGKTEVAIRAAFKAVMDGKQVAVLVPTTVLAQQHLETFTERFKDYPIATDMVSRFRSKAQQKEILKKTAEGKIEILIGTHRLLQRDVKFKELGLLIIDEEQRFGVTHKEKLKKLRAEVDILTLTATPIPRTLHMSLAGMRDLSIINTPPVDRQAIRTYVTKFDDNLIREAILRELRRGGQVFFVHNRVHTIEAMASLLKNLVPEAKLAVGHGQMPEKELEKVMLDFVEGKTNLLVCTTIIENGLDISRANTIIVNRADCFGLSQLYQLRGRVGRSHQRAYAYLLIPSSDAVTPEARERLKVLQELTELGAGFTIASHDLEIRGAGELLGAKQSGQVAAVGFEMYSELLEETIQEIKGQTRKELVDPEIKLGLSAFLPEKYVPDPNQRLIFYKKLSSAEEEDEIYALMDELKDRYGKIPEAGILLLEIMKLRVLMKNLKITLAEYDGRQIIFEFHAATPVQPEKILSLIQKEASRYTITPDYKLLINTGKLELSERLKTAKKELLTFL